MSVKPVRDLKVAKGELFNISQYPSFSSTGSIKGMRKVYGPEALLVRCGSYIYNVSANPQIYYDYAT